MPRHAVVRERNQRGMQLFLRNLKGIVNLLVNPQETAWTEEIVETTKRRLQDAYATLTLIDNDQHRTHQNESLEQSLLQLTGNIQSLHAYLVSCETVEHGSTAVSYTPPVQRREGPGRPSILIAKDQIEYLRTIHFSWEKIAKLLNISLSTLQRRRKIFQLDDKFEKYSDISDEQLDLIHEELTSPDTDQARGGFLTPNIGRRRFIGALRSRGIRVQRSRVCECLRRMDPIGTSLRWRLVIYRRKYSVPAPNSLWHFDGAHKLVRWKLVVHLCIDGFSRLIIYCKCCNNRAETVLNLFVEGTDKYGLPSRARCYVHVAQFMLEKKGLNRGSIITGSSVHNCRVERSHRDVYSGVLCFYAQLFNEMEKAGILDPLNDLHLYCLHRIYLPRINNSLEEFVSQMNNRPVSTENNNSPLQLWTGGMLQNVQSLDPILSESELDDYGFDPEGLVPVEDENYQVHLDPPAYAISDEQMLELPDPLENDEYQGQLSYLKCLEYILSLEENTGH